MRDLRQIKVWQKAHELVLAVYRATTRFPADERFGLTREVRRSAISVPSNIAEGCGRETEPDFARFLSIAAGSAFELDYQLLLARDLVISRSVTLALSMHRHRKSSECSTASCSE